jgi:hypothetical protein
MQGVRRETAETSKATKAAAQAERKALAETRKAQAESERAKRAATAATTKEARTQAREQQKLADEQSKYWRKAAQASADERIRQERRVTAVAQREAARRLQNEKQTLEAQKKANEVHARRGRAFLGGVVGAAVGGAMGASQTARSIGGIRSMPERIQAANEFRERLTIAASQANLSGDEKAKAEGQINAASIATGKDQGELLSVLETGQAKFNDLRFFADNLKEIATIARASGSDAGEFAQALGFTRQAFGLSGEEAMEAAKLMVAAASKGSIEVKDFASSFAPVAGLFAQSTGLKGIEGVRQFLGTAQAAGTLGKSADESATLVERFVASLADPKTRTGLKQSTGIDLKGKTPEALIAALADSKKFARPGVMQKVFTDVREQQAVTAMMAAFRRTREGKDGAIDIGAIANVQASEGAAITAKTMGELEGSGALAFDRQNATLQEHTLKNLGDYNAQLLKVNEMSMNLEMSFSKLALWSDAISASGIGAALGGMAAGGGFGGGGAAGGKMLGGLGKAVGVLGPALGILGGGAAISAAIVEAGVGEKVADFVFDLFNSDIAKMKAGGPTGDVKVPTDLPSNVVPIRPTAPASAPTGAGEQQSAATGQRVLKETEKQTRLLEQIAANGKPPPFHGPGPRGPK